MENVGIHLQARVDIFRDVGTEMSYKLHPSGWQEADFALWKHKYFGNLPTPAHKITIWEIIKHNYHVTSNLQSAFDAWGEGTRQCNFQRHTSDSRKEEFIVHKDVVGKNCVVSFGHQCFNQL